MEKPNKVVDYLKKHNIDFKYVCHKPVSTIEEMDDLGLSNSDCVVKNIFLKDDKKRNFYLVVLQKDKKVDLKKLRQNINSRALSFASIELLDKYLNLEKGAVSPLGLINDKNNDVTLVIDKDLENNEFIAIHPNINTATIWMKYQDLIAIIKEKGNSILITQI